MTDTPNTPNLAANEDIKETATSLDEMVKSIEKMRKLIMDGGGCPADKGDKIAVTITGYASIESWITIAILICGITIEFSFIYGKRKKKRPRCEITVTNENGDIKCERSDLIAPERILEHAITTIIQITTQK